MSARDEWKPGCALLSGMWTEPRDGRWEHLQKLAAGLDRLSDQASNTRRWTKDFNLKGKRGEDHFSELCGYPMNEKISIRDGGMDFPGIDVKTTVLRPGQPQPTLSIPVKDVGRSPFYYLVTLDERDGLQLAKGWGFATEGMVRRAEKMKRDGGPSFVLPAWELMTGEWLVVRLIEQLMGLGKFSRYQWRPR